MNYYDLISLLHRWVPSLITKNSAHMFLIVLLLYLWTMLFCQSVQESIIFDMIKP